MRIIRDPENSTLSELKWAQNIINMSDEYTRAQNQVGVMDSKTAKQYAPSSILGAPTENNSELDKRITNYELDEAFRIINDPEKATPSELKWAEEIIKIAEEYTKPEESIAKEEKEIVDDSEKEKATINKSEIEEEVQKAWEAFTNPDKTKGTVVEKGAEEKPTIPSLEEGENKETADISETSEDTKENVDDLLELYNDLLQKYKKLYEEYLKEHQKMIKIGEDYSNDKVSYDEYKKYATYYVQKRAYIKSLRDTLLKIREKMANKKTNKKYNKVSNKDLEKLLEDFEGKELTDEEKEIKEEIEKELKSRKEILDLELPKEALTVKLLSEKEYVKVTFLNNGFGIENYENLLIPKGTIIHGPVMPPVPLDKNGKPKKITAQTFDCWVDQYGNPVDFTKPIEEDMILSAKYKFDGKQALAVGAGVAVGALAFVADLSVPTPIPVISAIGAAGFGIADGIRRRSFRNLIKDNTETAMSIKAVDEIPEELLESINQQKKDGYINTFLRTAAISCGISTMGQGIKAIVDKANQAAQSIPQGNQPTPEVPKGNQPTPEVPKVNQPTPEVPKVNQPTPEVPKVNQPTPEVPKVNQPTPEVPKVNQPTPEVPKVNQPTPEVPKVNQPAPNPSITQPTQNPPVVQPKTEVMGEYNLSGKVYKTAGDALSKTNGVNPYQKPFMGGKTYKAFSNGRWADVHEGQTIDSILQSVGASNPGEVAIDVMESNGTQLTWTSLEELIKVR